MSVYSAAQLQKRWKDCRKKSAKEGNELHMRGVCNPKLNTSTICRSEGDFDVHGKVCVICRETKERWLFPYGLAFSQWGSAWGNDYRVYSAVTGDGTVQFQADGRHWPQDQTGYFAVNYEETREAASKPTTAKPALTKSQKASRGEKKHQHGRCPG
ncbi:hypothetical protein ACET7H_04540 [Aeromonas veronii]